MSLRGARLLLAVLAVSLLTPGCPGRKVRGLDSIDADATMGVYRARFYDDGSRGRRFRLLLFAAAPDRLHGEVVSPIGTTELIVDAGGGKIAVTSVDERVSYVGAAEAEVFEVLFGIPVELEALVAAILEGRAPGGGVTMVRVPDKAGLPARLEIAAAGRRLELELRRSQRVTEPSLLGVGEGPPGLESRPLSDLDPSLAPVRSAVEIEAP